MDMACALRGRSKSVFVNGSYDVSESSESLSDLQA